MILEQLYQEFHIPESKRPAQHFIDDGDIITIGSELRFEVLASSHTCFDSFGLLSRHQILQSTIPEI